MAFDFSQTDEQRMLVETVRQFIEKEIFPYEREVDRAGEMPMDLAKQIKSRAKEVGLYAANMPEEVGGGGLDVMSQMLMERELGKCNWALQKFVGRPSAILMACRDEQIEKYLLPTVRGEKMEVFALTEPGAGSDAMSISTRAEADGDDYVLNGGKHFISGIGLPDFAIVFTVTGVDETKRGPRKRVTAFLVDRDTPGFSIRRGPRCVSYRAYDNYELFFDNVRLNKRQILGEEGKGFVLANQWLTGGRVMVAANCCGKAERAMELATDWAATRKQFGQTIGKFQGTSFKLADMATELRAADALVAYTCWKLEQGTMTDADAAMAKLFASEMLGRVTDQAIQIFGGMGLMDELPLEMMWRDARIERIWEGTSEIQRHIISRDMLRAKEQ
ncbi:acyl-CoA dehydrogenase family protein [Dongia soli]|uniref:Medium-chain specific acyl-CoA dehydrogenase, mitochondrial n=1 Tax=Dongia soli TaxID=600628 RepID=A0ABU5EFR9_9PROT|nr:acyl-CoA dehydrogenase family protein [Dongia soli]MDY0885042.1 acyl-CoA dehydrogenase family protein [Dongia soli]